MSLKKLTRKTFEDAMLLNLENLETLIRQEMGNIEPRTGDEDLLKYLKIYKATVQLYNHYLRDSRNYRTYCYLEDNTYLKYKRGVKKSIGFKRSDKDE